MKTKKMFGAVLATMMILMSTSEASARHHHDDDDDDGCSRAPVVVYDPYAQPAYAYQPAAVTPVYAAGYAPISYGYGRRYRDRRTRNILLGIGTTALVSSLVFGRHR